MARPKNQDKRKKDLIRAAQRAIAKRGISTLRRMDIAEEAGVTGPAVSYYFPDLDELLEDVYIRTIESYIDKSKLIEKIDTPWNQLKRYIDLSVPFGVDDIDSVIMYQFSGEPRFAKTYSKMSAMLHQHQVSFLVGIINKGIEIKLFSPDLDSLVIARGLVALLDAYGIQVIMEEPGVDYQFTIEEIKQLTAALLNI